MGWYGLDWSGSEYGLVEGSCEHVNEPSGSIICWEFLSNCTVGSFSRRAQLHEWVVPEGMALLMLLDTDDKRSKTYICQLHLLWLRRLSDIKGTSVSYIWLVHDILMSLAYIGTSGRGEVAALISFCIHVSKLFLRFGKGRLKSQSSWNFWSNRYCKKHCSWNHLRFKLP
jgi:hypothetical protein